MVITNNTNSVTFTNVKRKQDFFKSHVRDTSLDLDKGTIAISLAGCKSPFANNHILITYKDVTTPAEASVSDLYDTILGYINS